ncbi:hypothetical protein EBQ93_00315 [bacterium]|nr:hypothetical protein [bacterium]
MKKRVFIGLLLVGVCFQLANAMFSRAITSSAAGSFGFLSGFCLKHALDQIEVERHFQVIDQDLEALDEGASRKNACRALFYPQRKLIVLGRGKFDQKVIIDDLLACEQGDKRIFAQKLIEPENVKRFFDGSYEIAAKEAQAVLLPSADVDYKKDDLMRRKKMCLGLFDYKMKSIKAGQGIYILDTVKSELAACIKGDHSVYEQQLLEPENIKMVFNGSRQDAQEYVAQFRTLRSADRS